MSRLVLVGLIMFAFACDTSRNTPDPEDKFFMRFYGDDGDQEGVDMVANDDGTFTLLGNSKSADENLTQPYLVKVNSHGIVIWEKLFDVGVELVAKDIEPTVSGGYVILTDKVNSATDTDFLLLIVDAEGTQTASGTFTYPGQSQEIGVSVTQIMNGNSGDGFIVTGSTNYDNGASAGFENITAVFARFDQTGAIYSNVSWTNNAGGEQNDYGIKVVQRADLSDPNPFVFFGYKNSVSNTDPTNGTYNYWMSKVNNSGEGVGSEILNGSPSNINEDEQLGSVSTINPGSIANYLLAGISTGGGQDKVFVASINDIGLTNDGIFTPRSLSFNLGDLGLEAPKFRKVSICHLQQTGYLVTANNVSSGSSDIVLMKLNVDGSEAWPMPVTIGGQGDDSHSSIYELPDGRFLVLGTMQIGDDRQSKMALIKLNNNGLLQD